MRSVLVSWMPLLMVPVFSLILNSRGCQAGALDLGAVNPRLAAAVAELV
jgi:hypothetical protein